MPKRGGVNKVDRLVFVGVPRLAPKGALTREEPSSRIGLLGVALVTSFQIVQSPFRVNTKCVADVLKP